MCESSSIIENVCSLLSEHCKGQHHACDRLGDFETAIRDVLKLMYSRNDNETASYMEQWQKTAKDYANALIKDNDELQQVVNQSEKKSYDLNEKMNLLSSVHIARMLTSTVIEADGENVTAIIDVNNKSKIVKVSDSSYAGKEICETIRGMLENNVNDKRE